MDSREELAALRRMAELEAKASGQPANSGMPVGRSGVSQIPTEPSANLAPTVAPSLSTADKIRGVIETPLAVGANLLSGPVTYLAGAGGPDFQRKVAEAIQYQPRTQMAQDVLGAVGQGFEASKLPPFMPMIGGAANALAPAARAANDVARSEGSLVAGSVNQMVANRAAKTQQTRVDQSYANAPMIDATQAALRIGGAVPPAISNPTKANVIKGKLAGPEVETRLAKNNEIAVTEKVREDLGIKPNERLTPEIDANGKLNVNSPITRAIDEASAPYEPIRKMESLAVPDESIKAIEGLKKQAPIGGGAKTDAINSLVDDAVAKLQQTTSGPFSGVGGGAVPVGRSGAAVLDDIRSLRRDAQSTYQAQKINPDPLAKAKADTQMSIANILEGVIDANATSPEMLGNLKAARTRIAQINDHVRAIDYGQQKIDPQIYAKLFEERQGAMTGLNGDIAKAASMFPDYFTLTPAQVTGLPRITRSGFGGALGAAIGAPLGLPGILAGTSVGMAAGATAGSLAARRIATPAYQRANALAPDYRPAPNMLRPVEPNATPNGLMPYDYSQQTFTPPNFVMQPGQYPPRTSFVGPETGAPQLGMGREPVGGGQTAALRAEDARVRALSESQDLQAQAASAQAAAATRQPARGGTAMVFDERGKLIPADQTLRGATPNIQVIESTGKNLSGAADILASNRSPALMSAEQKIAWEKTKVDLADVVPGMKALNDKALAAKLMDRQWVESAITKAKEKAAAFDELSKRDVSLQKIREAVIEREKMQGIAEMLQEQLGSRPTQRGYQGPKTQVAQRNKNAMRPTDVEIKNALIGK